MCHKAEKEQYRILSRGMELAFSAHVSDATYATVQILNKYVPLVSD
jgi:hypothetical protein